MKDERQSTAVSEAEWDAETMRLMLGRRIRTARTALRLSQQAVADAMRERGFNWRQTTVAKAEAADRPTLFTEVVALSLILKRDLGFFLSGRTALDDVKEELQQEVKSLEQQVRAAETSLRAIKHRLEEATSREGVALAITEFAYTLDSGALKNSIEIFAAHSSFDVQRYRDVLDAAGIPSLQVGQIDAAGLRAAAREARDSPRGKRVYWFTREDGGDADLANRYLHGQEVPSVFLNFLRLHDSYKNEAGRLLVDAVIEHVEPRGGR